MKTLCVSVATLTLLLGLVGCSEPSATSPTSPESPAVSPSVPAPTLAPTPIVTSTPPMPTPSPSVKPTPEDKTPPIVSGVSASKVDASSATITWTTEEPSTSQIDYGKTTDYGLTTSLDKQLTTRHSTSFSGLEPKTAYHFRVRSKDRAANEALSGDFTFNTSKLPTSVSGIMSSNTIWTEESSPYVITRTIQIPSGVTLTIEPGVTITSPDPRAMFLLQGAIFARGTPSKNIIFDGGGVSQIFITTGGGVGSADLDYVVIRNGQGFWDGSAGHFNLTHSELSSLTKNVYVGSASEEMHVEYNRFTNTGGLALNPFGGATIYVRYNLFQATTSAVIPVWKTPDRGITIVKYNSFIDIRGEILGLYDRIASADVDVAENYWGTLDTHIIDQKIVDENDSITLKGHATYLPILTEPNPNTPAP